MDLYQLAKNDFLTKAFTGTKCAKQSDSVVIADSTLTGSMLQNWQRK